MLLTAQNQAEPHPHTMLRRQGRISQKQINILWSKPSLEMSSIWSGASHNTFKENLTANYADSNVTQASDWKAQGVPSSGYTTMGLMCRKYWVRFCEALFLGQVQTSKAKDSGTVCPLGTMVTLWRNLDVHALNSLQCLCMLSIRYTSRVCFNTEDGRFGILKLIWDFLWNCRVLENQNSKNSVCISK